MAGKVIAGIITGIIGSAIWQNGIKFLFLLFFLYQGERSYSAASMASNCGLIAAFVMLAFYFIRAVRQSSAAVAWGKNLINLAYSVLVCGGIAGFAAIVMAHSSDRHRGLVIVAGGFVIGLVFFLIGRASLRGTAEVRRRVEG